MTKTITIMPESNDTTLFVHLHDTIGVDDYMQIFDAPVRAIQKKNGWYNLLVYYDRDFKGWSEQAAALSFKCITDIGGTARRLAYVSPPDQRILLMKMMRPIIKAEIRYFNLEDLDEAIAWMQAYKPEAP